MKLAKIAALTSMLAAFTWQANAADVELRLSHWLPATHPMATLGLAPWIKSIEDESKGRIHITVFPAQQLGAAPDHYDMARDGIADITYTNPGYQAGRFPLYSLRKFPFM